MTITYNLARSKTDYGRCVYLRALVFGTGQNVSINEDIDEHEDECRYLLAMDETKPCATARWRIYKPGIVKIERVAVHPDWQGKGIGRQLMLAVIEDIRGDRPDIETFRLGSQDHAIPFYERLGFTTVGDGFMDANIPHHWMERAA